MVESTRESLLAELAAMCGVEPQYHDIAGNLQVAAVQTQAAILSAMGCRCQTVADISQELERRRGWPWSELVEPVLALCQSQLPVGWTLYLPLSGGELPPGLAITWELIDEWGHYRSFDVEVANLRVEETRCCGAAAFGRVRLPLPLDLALGYYDLNVRVHTSEFARQGRLRLIIAPERLYVPAILLNERLWGFNLPLYAVRSGRNWGIGDCGDLKQLLEVASRLKADVIGLNPLHHLGIHLQDSLSPYYPTSRCFGNPLYLDLDQVPEMSQSSQAKDLLASAEVQEQLARLRQAQQVNYPEVAKLKSTILGHLLDSFVENHGWPSSPRTSRGRDFAVFLEQQGESLQQFAAFLALSEYWQAQGQAYLTWQQWPEAFHDPRGPAVTDFANRQARQLLIHAYAQWLLAQQLQETQVEARNRHISVGLYLDLAVGVNPGGFDTWAHQELFALGIDIGAPPDEFSPLGQNWCLAPLLPQPLRDQGYRYFIQMLRQNSQHGGALRIDHVMGLFRLYWIPRGATAAQGAYIRYAADEMLKIVALESLRQKTIIIGEDLGTVAPYIREQLQAYRVLSTRLFYFERQGNGAFNQAAQYPEFAQAAITTHDLPTLAGFWQGRDIKIREELNLFPNAEFLARAWEDRRQAKAAIIALLCDTGALDQENAATLSASADLPEQVKWGLVAHLAQTPCRLALLSLEDIFGWLEQQNLPGTKDEYPNWRLKFPLRLEEIVQAPELEHAAQIMRQFRSGAASEKE